MSKISAIWLLGLLVLGTVSCTYKDPEILAHIYSKSAKPDSHILAVGTQYIKWQWPSGISAFPNGGIPKVWEQEARIYICDADDPENIEQIVLIFDPKKYSSPRPKILGWIGQILFFRVDLNGVGEGSAGETFFYQWGIEGGLAQIPNAPNARDLQSGSPKDRVFVEHDHDSTQTIAVRTDRNRSWQKDMFRIDPATGHLMGRMR